MNLYNEKISTVINKLSDVIRNDYVSDNNDLELYVGQETIQSIDNKKYQVIYGRRGTGKTHLLKAYKQTLLNNFAKEKTFPIYIDLRRFIPLLSNTTNNTPEAALIIYKNIVEKIVANLIENIEIFCEHKTGLKKIFSNEETDKTIKLKNLLEKFTYQLDGKIFTKFTDTELSIQESESLSENITLSLSSNPYIKYNTTDNSNYIIKENTKNVKYIPFSSISDYLTEIVSILGIEKVVCILDEWAEIPNEVQLILADLIKKSFITNPFIFKIAAIPNRTNLGELVNQNYIGLEEGGDIFAFNLDNRLIYEQNPELTKSFYNDLLYKHLTNIDKRLNFNVLNSFSKRKFINEFLANVALREILIASAGIPRDFISLFINSYGKFKINTSSKSKKIGAKDIRSATVEWYKVDKEPAVNKIESCKTMLRNIIIEIVKKTKKTHFLIPQKFSDEDSLKALIDFRVIHLRKKGYSHKDKVGMVYDVYSIDYGCYTSIDIPESTLDGDFINKIEIIDNFREIRRISLEDKFFDSLKLENGEGFKCPNCKKIVNITHLAYIKQKLCNHCFESISKETSA